MARPFAAAIGKGIALDRRRWSEALRTGAIFGVIVAATPIVGSAIGLAAARDVAQWDRWIAFVLLGGLGLRVLAFVDIDRVPVAAAIGFPTFGMVTIGVMFGRVLGSLAGRWAEVRGGLVLIGIGSGILYEHLSGAA